jgi:hypothetical protein
MNQSQPKFIGKRIRVIRQKDRVEVHISQKIERWQEALLLGWLAGWTFCGGVFIYYLLRSTATSDKIFFIVCSALWLYFFVRILKVFLWRIGGTEILVVEQGKLTLRNAFWSWGRKEVFPIQQIFRLGIITKSPTSFLAFLDDSFWIIGGERVGFSFSGRQVVLGKQIEPRDAELLVRVLEGSIREFGKKNH